jgi:hypothetical protein
MADKLVTVERGTDEFQARVEGEVRVVGREGLVVDEPTAKKLVELGEASGVVLKVEAAPKEEK